MTDEELLRVSQIAPEERGTLNVTQRILSTSDPQDEPYDDVAPYAYGPPMQHGVALPPGVVGLLADPTLGSGGLRQGRGSFSRRARVSRERRSQDGQGIGDSEGDDSDEAWLLSAAAATFILAGFTAALTEGVRFEGEVRVSPRHPLYLRGPNGEHVWIPLNELKPSLAQWAEEGVLLRADGAVLRGERLPLNRRGLALDFNIGIEGEQRLDGEFGAVVVYRFGIGVFPVHELGVLLVGGFGTRPERFQPRVLLELQAFPIKLETWEVGLYGHIGAIAASQGDQDANTNLWGGGLLIQHEVATRLAFNLRAGVISTTFPEGHIRPEIFGGISVY